MRPAVPVSALATAALLLGGSAAWAHDESDTVGGKLGAVHFKVSCRAAAQKDFDLAMAYMHSFAHEHMGAPLDRALKADPKCGMVHWARALILLDNPFGWPSNLRPEKLAEGPALLEAARQTGLRTQREKDYVDALENFFRDADKLNHATRAKALEAGLEAVAKKYPTDTEAAILHSLVLSANFDPADKQYGNQLRAAQRLEPIFMKQPQHPGVAHYLIHSYDYPPLAQKGLDAARRYSKIAPAASHAQHMPSHIFTRVGAWEDSVVANAASANAPGAAPWNALHAYDYMVYAHLQLGQDRAAQATHDRAFATKIQEHPAAAFAATAIPARLVLERSDWAAAAQLPMPALENYPWGRFTMAEANNAYARGLGAAMLKQPAAVEAELARLQALREKALQAKIGYWAEQFAIQSDVLRSLATFRTGDAAAGLEGLRKAADREDASEKAAVTPGPLLPAREILATALLERGDAAAAQKEFEAVLVKEPNRLRALAGASIAAERSGDAAAARTYADKVARQTAKTDAGTSGEQLARQAVLKW